MGKMITVPELGRAYLPSAWEDSLDQATPIRRYALGRELPLNQVLKELRLGRAVVLSGPWELVLRLLSQVEGRRTELLSGAPPKGRQAREAARQEVLSRLLLVATSDGQVDTQPPLQIPHLLELLGDQREASGGQPILVPVSALCHLLSLLEDRYPVHALETDLWSPNSVLQPRQQEVYDLMRERLAALGDSLPPEPRCLDMGCGSGALALLMAKELRPLNPRVWATDALPEALATTRLNAAQLRDEGLIDGDRFQVTEGGDLYQPLRGLQFHLIAFNPPWANARPRTRLEIARFDQGQETLFRFLQETPPHLGEGGHLLLFYADNAGPKAIEGLLRASERAGLQVVETLSRRIRVARRWEHIYLYDMVRLGDRAPRHTKSASDHLGPLADSDGQ